MASAAPSPHNSTLLGFWLQYMVHEIVLLVPLFHHQNRHAETMWCMLSPLLCSSSMNHDFHRFWPIAYFLALVSSSGLFLPSSETQTHTTQHLCTELSSRPSRLPFPRPRHCAILRFLRSRQRYPKQKEVQRSKETDRKMVMRVGPAVPLLPLPGRRRP